MGADPAAAAAGTDTGTDAGDDTGADAGADMGTDDTGDTSNTVLVTIAQGPDGGYIVYAGDEPDEGSDDDEGAAADAGAAGGGGGGGGGAGGAGAAAEGAEGRQVDSIGAALKAALDILNESASSQGEAGSSEDQFTGGYGADQSATPASARPARSGLKYPPATAAA